MKTKTLFASALAAAFLLSGCGAVTEDSDTIRKRSSTSSRSKDEPSESSQTVSSYVKGEPSESSPTVSSYVSGYDEPVINLLPEGEFPMPDLVGMTWEEANEKYGKYVTLVAEQQYTDAPKGAIFDQDPPKGQRTKLNQTVTVKVSMGRKMIEIYDFTGRQADYAKQQLQKDGFNPTTVIREDDTIPNGCVIETNPPAHTMAEQGSTIVVIVSRGPKNSSVEVPKLVDRTIDEALKICNDLYLDPEVEIVDSDQPQGTVIAQSIDAGNIVGRNTTIILTVSTGNPG